MSKEILSPDEIDSLLMAISVGEISRYGKEPIKYNNDNLKKKSKKELIEDIKGYYSLAKVNYDKLQESDNRHDKINTSLNLEIEKLKKDIRFIKNCIERI